MQVCHASHVITGVKMVRVLCLVAAQLFSCAMALNLVGNDVNGIRTFSRKASTIGSVVQRLRCAPRLPSPRFSLPCDNCHILHS